MTGHIFECAMLICFGFSWPMNVAKAYKARTAKGTSLWFILLIITGYICGIVAKFMNHQLNYVLAVYFLNLVIVLANLGVYIRNVALDNKEKTPEQVSEGIVLFGNGIDKMIPADEISKSVGYKFPVLNKSLEKLSLANASVECEKIMKACNPEGILIHLGKNDLKLFNENSVAFDANYLRLISAMKSMNSKLRIGLVGNYETEDEYTAMNKHIRAIADSENCEFINVEATKNWDMDSARRINNIVEEIGIEEEGRIKKPLFDVAKLLFGYEWQVLLSAEKPQAEITA